MLNPIGPRMRIRVAADASRLLARVARVLMVPALLGTMFGTAALAGAEDAPSPSPTIVAEDDDARLTLTGGWRFDSTTLASGGTRRSATTTIAVARLRFSGTGAALISRVTTAGGTVEVSVDGTAPVAVDLAGVATVERARVWSVEGLAPGIHDITVKVAGSGVDAATLGEVVIDAFEVDGTVLEAPRPSGFARVEESNRKVRLLGAWRERVRVSTASGGRLAVANGVNASVVITFRGTAVSWIAPNQSAGAKAQITLDGVSRGYVSLARAGALGTRRVMWSIGGLPLGTHTLVVRAAALPLRNSKVALDAFEIEGTALEAAPKSSLGYPWRNYLVVDKSEFRTYLVLGGRVVRTYPNAHGRVSMRTPSAVWRIDAKYYTYPAGVYGPRKLRMFRRRGSTGHYWYEFTRYALHGTNEPWVIGTLASHGCIRHYNDDILDLFGRVPLGTMVITRD